MGSAAHASLILRVEMHKILSPFDASPGSRDNLHYASAVAKAANAELLVVYVLVLPFVTPIGAPLPPETEAQLGTVLAEAAEIAQQYGVTPRSTVVDGRAVGPAIVAVAEEENVDAIFMALRHTHVTAETLILGATVRHVLQHAPCPVFVSHTPAGHHRRP